MLWAAPCSPTYKFRLSVVRIACSNLRSWRLCQLQPLSFAAACLKTDEPEKCTHKLAEMPRWLSSNKMEIVKGILAGAHTCSRAGPQTPSMYVHNADLSPTLAQMIRPCCMLALFACPHCTSCLTLRAPTQSPRVNGPCLRRHAQGLPVAPGGCVLQPPANRRRLSPIRVRASRQHQCARNSLLSHAHFSDQTGQFVCYRTSSLQWTRREAAHRSLRSARPSSCRMARWSCWAWTSFVPRFVTALRF